MKSWKAEMFLIASLAWSQVWLTPGVWLTKKKTAVSLSFIVEIVCCVQTILPTLVIETDYWMKTCKFLGGTMTGAIPFKYLDTQVLTKFATMIAIDMTDIILHVQ